MDTFLRVKYHFSRKAAMSTRTRRNPSEEFKEEAVKLITEQGYSIVTRIPCSSW